MDVQQTLKRQISCAGIGLHSGQKVTLTLKPAPADTGIRFRRTDLGIEIPATVDHVSAVQYATVLGRDGATVETVEHLLAALMASGIDNVDRRIEPARSADHGWQQRAVPVPAAGSGSQAAGAGSEVPEGAPAPADCQRGQAHRGVPLGSLQGELHHQLRPSTAAPSDADRTDHGADLQRAHRLGAHVRVPEGSRMAAPAGPRARRLARERHRHRRHRRPQRPAVRGRVRAAQDPRRRGRSGPDRVSGGRPRRGSSCGSCLAHRAGPRHPGRSRGVVSRRGAGAALRKSRASVHRRPHAPTSRPFRTSNAGPRPTRPSFLPVRRGQVADCRFPIAETCGRLPARCRLPGP